MQNYTRCKHGTQGDYKLESKKNGCTQICEAPGILGNVTDALPVMRVTRGRTQLPMRTKLSPELSVEDKREGKAIA